MGNQRLINRLAWVATCLALIVIALGAYTRLTDSGLGCPDWPGCYGELVVPEQQAVKIVAQSRFPAQAIEPTKAWHEMIHRYVAGSLGLLTIALAGLLIWQRRRPTMIAIMLMTILAFQATLGMWTVTWQLLPLVVMGHLLGGLLLASCLYMVWLSTRSYQGGDLSSQIDLKPWALLGLMLLVLQIALGGWTSANYAAISCPDFPMCQGQWLPDLNWQQAFNFMAPIGRNYEGGHLDNMARVTIQVTHRIGAVVVALYLLGLSLAIWRFSKGLRHLAMSLALLLSVQIGLGIVNAMHLPLSTAVAHNLIAALLLLVLITINYHVLQRMRLSRA